jgi:hypothetical protein
MVTEKKLRSQWENGTGGKRSPAGSTNHAISGENNCSSPEPQTEYMFCADSEIPVLTRQLMSSK